MSFLKNLFRGKVEGENISSGHERFEKVSKTSFSTFDELVSQHAAMSLEKQSVLGEVIGTNSWNFDMTKGMLSFGGSLQFPVQVIGSLSFLDKSWMWGWANAKSGIPEHLLVQSKQLKSLGDEKNIRELMEGHYNVSDGFEHKIGIIACGIFKSKCYYCANYGKGTLVVTIESDKIPAIDISREDKILTFFPQVISSIDTNHKSAFINYLIDRGFKLFIEKAKVQGLRTKTVIEAEFDEMDRLVKLSGGV